MKSENSTQYLIHKPKRDRHLSFDPLITKEKCANHQTTGSQIHPTREEYYTKTVSALIIYNNLIADLINESVQDTNIKLKT